MKKIVLIIAMSIFMFSCHKNENVNPTQANTPFVNTNLTGKVWNCWKFQQYDNNTMIVDTTGLLWNFKFDATKFYQDFDNDGIYEYSYYDSYASNTVSIVYSPSNTSVCVITNDTVEGNLILTSTTNNGQNRKIWYIK